MVFHQALVCVCMTNRDYQFQTVLPWVPPVWFSQSTFAWKAEISTLYPKNIAPSYDEGGLRHDAMIPQRGQVIPMISLKSTGPSRFCRDHVIVHWCGLVLWLFFSHEPRNLHCIHWLLHAEKRRLHTGIGQLEFWTIQKPGKWNK